tara:strand:+ start:278 stop:742 length:465 start_codon:yes stop_codon:yes gene_type:complete
MIKKYKNIIVIIFLLLLTSCGYTPILNSEKTNFYINDLNFEGERKINNYISKNLKKYQRIETTTKKYDIKIISYYEKKVVNKDDSGNPKNYNIKVTSNVNFVLNGKDQINKIFERNTSFSAQDKKISEKKLELRNKKNLSNLISEDIIFFLINQ